MKRGIKYHIAFILFIISIFSLGCGSHSQSKDSPFFYADIDDSIPPPPRPPKLPSQIKLEEEIDSLNRNREKLILELSQRIADSCKIMKSNSVVIRIVIENSGDLDSINIFERPNNIIEDLNCVQNYFDSNNVNLGKMKYKKRWKRANSKYTLGIGN